MIACICCLVRGKDPEATAASVIDVCEEYGVRLVANMMCSDHARAYRLAKQKTNERQRRASS